MQKDIRPIPGIEVYVNSVQPLKHIRIAMVTNDAAKTNNGIPSRLALLQAGYQLTKLFSPEHGIHVMGADGVAQQDGADSLTLLPVTSLYGQKLKPTAEDLEGIDAVLFDIPDVGCRFYTYLWTMTYIMEACAANNKPLVILDRPNPTGGDLSKAEGPMLDEVNCSSFIGRWSIPVRHCCTLGELALCFQQTRLPALDLQVIPCQNWDRHASWVLHPHWFQPTSPAISNIETACIYPGTGFWEGVNLHDGRGTPYPFRWFGAPWIDTRLIQSLEKWKIKGLSFSPYSTISTSVKYHGELCHGAILSLTDEKLLRPVEAGIQLLQLVAALYPSYLTPAVYPTLANPTGERHLDLLLGFPNAFEAVVNHQQIETDCCVQWQRTMKPFLIY